MSTSKEKGNFFGLFGCEANKERGDRPMKRPNESTELEEGEIADLVAEEESQENVPFDTLISSFQQEESRKLTFKETKKCLVCLTNLPKYTCPKCGMKTCSLNCCLRHKKDFNCDGVRDHLSFVPLKSYSEQNFQSDCKFLDEACEAVGNSGRTFNNGSSRDISNWTNRFIQEAIRRKINYKKMPSSFKKARLNQSLFVYKEKIISWDIEFVLPYCSLENPSSSNCDITNTKYDAFHSFTFKRSRISETQILGEVIQNIISGAICGDTPESDDKLKDSTIPQMTAYITVPKENIVALFKHDSGKFHYLLNTSLTLTENFAHKTIVEYPTIVIILQQFLSNYVVQTDTR